MNVKADKDHKLFIWYTHNILFFDPNVKIACFIKNTALKFPDALFSSLCKRISSCHMPLSISQVLGGFSKESTVVFNNVNTIKLFMFLAFHQLMDFVVSNQILIYRSHFMHPNLLILIVVNKKIVFISMVHVRSYITNLGC